MNNIVEVYPNNNSDTNFPAVKFDEVREYNLDECWDLDGDELVVLMNTKNMNSTCPAMLTPDIFTSPSPATIKLSISDTRLCISC